jgi:hypothetical protein
MESGLELPAELTLWFQLKHQRASVNMVEAMMGKTQT